VVARFENYNTSRFQSKHNPSKSVVMNSDDAAALPKGRRERVQRANDLMIDYAAHVGRN
jgi:hypothetical protein